MGSSLGRAYISLLCSYHWGVLLQGTFFVYMVQHLDVAHPLNGTYVHVQHLDGAHPIHWHSLNCLSNPA